MHNKKAQTAMEFLITYGWAILVVLIVLAALFILGIFNPRVSNTCCSNTCIPFVCSDVKVIGTTLSLVLGATGSFSSGPSIAATGVTINGLSSTQCCVVVPGQSTCTPGSGPCVISATAPAEMKWTIPSQTAGSKFSGTATASYTQTGGTSHTTTITFSGTAE
jgi:hypothetical protein